MRSAFHEADWPPDFSAPPATINSWAAGLQRREKANDRPSIVRIDLP